MKRRYGFLAAGLLAAGLVLGAMARMPRTELPAPADMPEIRRDVVIAIRADGEVIPERVSVPVGAEVTLVAANEGAAPRGLTLSGYDDRLHLVVPPAKTARARFRADRPGAEFVWLVDGVPSGRVIVAGSHLIEGHE
jgi:hypothetical protein